MTVKQISVFLENKRGRLAQVTRVLKEKDIDISAISVADTANYGIIRMIVNRPTEAIEALRAAGFTVNTADVIAVEVPDSPGGLHRVLELLNQNDVSIEYLYSFVRKPSIRALILFRVHDPLKTAKVLNEAHINVLSPKEVYEL